MRNDWKTIYGEDVVKTGTFHWLTDYPDREPQNAETVDASAAEEEQAEIRLPYLGTNAISNSESCGNHILAKDS